MQVCGFLRTARAKQSSDPKVIAALRQHGLWTPHSTPTVGSATFSSAPTASANAPSSSKQQSILSHMKVKGYLSKEDIAQATEEFADMIYITNTPFNWAASPSVQKFFRTVAPNFPLPSRKQLANSLLNAAHIRMKARVEEVIATTPYFALTSDGWSRSQGNEHIINYQACSLSKAFFVDAVSVFEESITAELIADRAAMVLAEQPFSDRVIAYVTDNGANFKASWRLLKERLPNLQITFGCLPHGINLFLKVMVHRLVYCNALSLSLSSLGAP